MTPGSVWAPHARDVVLHRDGRRVTLEPTPDHWWVPLETHGAPGIRYGFSLDGGPPLPDPRSPFQPDGPHGLSESIDHNLFPWTDQDWRGVALPGSVIYEAHIGTFTPEGTFDAAIEKIPHLLELGVDAIELMPVAEFPGERGWGYDGVDLFAPHHSYGGPDGLKRLIDACHESGLGVVMDVVYNHLGPDGNYLARFGPYFSDREETIWGPAVNFDGPGSDEVRRFAIDNVRMWLRDYHCDGLRLDAVHSIVDRSATHILEEIGREVDALAAQVNRPLFVVAESDRNDPRLVRDRNAGGYGLAAVWSDDWHHAVHASLSGETEGYYEDYGDLEALTKALAQAWVYDGTWSDHRQRRHGASPEGLARHHFVVATQNHDQVGNRARGRRSSHLMSTGRLEVAAALLLTSPFTPMLFQGEEWGAGTPFRYFTDHQDPNLGSAVSEGRRFEFAAFGWEPSEIPDPQAMDTFVRSKLDWDEPGRNDHARILRWYATLVGLRKTTPELSDPRPESINVSVDPDTSLLVVERGAVIVLANLGPAPSRFEFGGSFEIMAASRAGEETDGNTVTVSPDAAVIARVSSDR
jgi:maltooligosyltrehalose trehalohydrolase